jgi:hypothetical protein
MDSASATPNPTTVDNSDAGELQQWIVDNDSKLTPVEKELFSELDPNLL